MPAARATAVAACLAAVGLAPAAAAHHKPVTIDFATRPPALVAGQVWGVTLVVRQDGKPVARRPTMQATLGARRVSFAARPTAKRGYYRVRVRLPRAGRWVATARIGGRIEALGRLTVRAGRAP